MVYRFHVEVYWKPFVNVCWQHSDLDLMHIADIATYLSFLIPFLLFYYSIKSTFQVAILAFEKIAIFTFAICN